MDAESFLRFIMPLALIIGLLAFISFAQIAFVNTMSSSTSA